MQFFRDYDQAVEIRNQNAEADPDWQYIVQSVLIRNNTRQAWIIQVRDQDNCLLGCL